MPSACSGAPRLPGVLTIATKDVHDMNPLEAFMKVFEPNSIDGPLHPQFRPMFHAALEYWHTRHDRLAVEIPAEDTRVKIHDEHRTGLDG